jgi:two-component system cell cycle response regulator DivK
MSETSTPNQEEQREIAIYRETVSIDQLSAMMHELAAKLSQSTDFQAGQILVVEDNENNSALVEDILDSIHMDCHIVTHAQAAIDYCSSNTPLMILMDIGLPEMDGLELTAHLRQSERFEHVPVVAVSAHSGLRMQDRAQEVGCDDFLAKPFTPSQLIDIVDRYTDKQMV